MENGQLMPTGQLTVQQKLAVVNNHINNAIKETCGQSGDHHRWDLNEINDIINFMGYIRNDFQNYENVVKAQKEEIERLMKELDKLTPVSENTKKNDIPKANGSKRQQNSKVKT